MKRTFVEFAAVSRALSAAGVSDDAIRQAHKEIMEGTGDVIPGAGGLRKIRCAAFGRGKSGGVRLVFADYPEAGICIFVAAFAKNIEENLSKAERNELATIKGSLDRRVKAPPSRSS